MPCAAIIHVHARLQSCTHTAPCNTRIVYRALARLRLFPSLHESASQWEEEARRNRHPNSYAAHKAAVRRSNAHGFQYITSYTTQMQAKSEHRAESDEIKTFARTKRSHNEPSVPSVLPLRRVVGEHPVPRSAVSLMQVVARSKCVAL